MTNILVPRVSVRAEVARDLEHPAYQLDEKNRREVEDLEERGYVPPKGTGREYKRPTAGH